MPNNEVDLRDIFTPETIEKARPFKDDAKKLQSEIIEPMMDHINKVTGQENDPGYWSYALQYYFMQEGDQ